MHIMQKARPEVEHLAAQLRQEQEVDCYNIMIQCSHHRNRLLLYCVSVSLLMNVHKKLRH